MLRTVACIPIALVCGCLMPNPSYLGESQSGSGTEGFGGSTESSGTDGDDTSTTGMSASGASSDPSLDTSVGTSASTGDVEVAPTCPSNPSLIACLPFDVPDPTQVADQSSYMHPVIVQAGSLVDTPWDRGFLFDPAARMELECAPECAGGPSVTYEAWVRLDAVPLNRAGIVDNNGILGVFVSDSLELRCNSGNGTAAGGQVPLSEWVHVACVADGESLTAYLDGVEVAQFTIVPLSPSNNTRLAIGNDTPSFGDPLVGALDSVRLWDVALTPQEISEAAAP